MSLSNKDILDAIANMSVMEVVDLVSAMEEKFGVSAAAVAPVAVAVDNDSSTDDKEEQSEFNVMLNSFGDKKIGVIKVVRAITGLGLKEAKDLVEKSPSSVKDGVNKEEAESLKKQLEDAGATVELK